MIFNRVADYAIERANAEARRCQNRHANGFPDAFRISSWLVNAEPRDCAVAQAGTEAKDARQEALFSIRCLVHA